MPDEFSYHGRLELTWTNKDLCLLAHDDGSYEWLPPTDYRVAEVRLLREAAEVGDSPDNLLIRGDALSALHALAELQPYAGQYVGQVRLAYLDPPFNTQQSFLRYDDALGHSVWLTMMRDRLVQVQRLLAENGSVWVHCDDYEQAHLRVLMDEVFGRDRFVATIVWEKADSPRNSAKQFSTDQDYILVYGSAPDWVPHRLPRTAESDAIYANPDDDPRGAWLAGDPFANKPYSKGTYTITGPTGREFQPPRGRYWRISEQAFWELDADGRIWWGPSGNARPSIKRYLSEVSDLVPRTLWSKEDVGHNRRAKNEIRALFPDTAAFDTPKPEALLQRILQIASEPGDIVLDCFLGSGTTAAVAQKMGRRWVGVERRADTLDRFAIPRLERVVAGLDPGGITETVGWEGGGGFRVLEVGPSMFDEDDGVVVLADWAINNALSEATAAQLGFAYEPASPFCGRKGRSRLAVIDGLVNADVATLLARALGDDEQLVVCGTSVDPEAADVLRERRPGSRVRKIPASLLTEYQEAARWRPRITERSSPPQRLPRAVPVETEEPVEA